MTEKTMKSLKMKNKPLKFKNPKVPKKAVGSDSDISEPDVSEKMPKMDKKALKQISTEVTDLLASLKKEHGMDDDPKLKVAVKKEKKSEKINKIQIKKEEEDVNTVDIKKVKKEKKSPQNSKNENKTKNLVKIEKGIKIEKDVAKSSNTVEESSPKKKKNKKNNKRTAVDAVANDDEPQVKKIKENPNKNQKQKQKQKPNERKPAAKKVSATEEKEVNDEATEENAEETEIKNEYYLKDATPVYVGNLPVNIKRVKLLKLFKKFGKILSIRFRTNTGKSFYKKSQVEKVPYLIAFVYFDTREAAEASVECNGTKIGDNVISVDVDHKENKVIKPQTTVVVGNLKFAVTDNILRDAFKCCGEIENVRTVQTLKGCKGVAFIRFAKAESVALALKLNGTSILDREIRVERYKQNYNEKKIKKENTQKPQKLGKVKKNANATNTEKGKKSVVSPVSKIGDKKKKNKEFMGVKSNDGKKTLKKNKNKKKKISNEKLLAKKVAPKSEKTSD